jgi:hypothetical protein
MNDEPSSYEITSIAPCPSPPSIGRAVVFTQAIEHTTTNTTTKNNKTTATNIKKPTQTNTTKKRDPPENPKTHLQVN